MWLFRCILYYTHISNHMPPDTHTHTSVNIDDTFFPLMTFPHTTHVQVSKYTIFAMEIRPALLYKENLLLQSP